MLRNLTATGFKKHREVTAQLLPGLNYIVGPNYSGKSSLLQAILFALGGVQAVSGGAEAAYGWDSKSTVVSVSWGPYEITRTRTSGGTELLQDGTMLASGITAVNQRLTRIFGMPAKDLMKIIYAEQGSTAALVSDLGEGEVNRLIETLSGVSEVDTYLRTISAMRSEVKGSLAVFGEATVPLEELEASRGALASREEVARLELDSRQKDVASLVACHDKLELEYAAALQSERATTAVHNIEKDLVDLQETKDSVPLEAEVTKAQVTQSWEAYKLQEESSQGLREQYRAGVKYAAEVSAAVEEVMRAERALPSEERILAVNSGVTENGGALSDIKAKADIQRQIAAEALEDIKLREGMLGRGVCPTCNRPYDGTNVDVTATEATLTKARGNLKIANGELRKLSETYKSYDVLYKEYLSEQMQREGVAAQLSAAESRLKDLQIVSCETVSEEELQASLDSVAELKDKFRALEKLHEGYRRSKEHHTRIQEKIKAAELAWESARAVVKAYGKLEPSKSLLASVQKANRDHRAAMSAVSQLSSSLATLRSEVARLADAIKSEEARIETVASLTNREAGLTRLRLFLKDNRARYLEGVWSRVLFAASEVMRVTTGGLLQELSRVEGAFRYREEGSDKFRPLAAASGSQKSIIGVGIKLALAKSLPGGIDFILLDESTSDMDSTHSAALMKYLQGCGLQVLAVTHNQEDLAVDAHVIQLER